MAALESLREALEAQLDASAETVQPVDLDAPIGRLSRMDAIQQQKMAQANRRRAELRYRHVLAALNAVRDGSYGECRRCEEMISTARLRARPEAPVCLACASALEGGA